jgi:hypothetical protein
MAKWWFVTWSIYGWWLPGDPRGFQTRRGREYVPPPARYAKPGEPVYNANDYTERWQEAKNLCPDAVVLTEAEQKLAFPAVVSEINSLAIVPRILGFGRTHSHLLAQFGALPIRSTVGRFKSAGTRALPNPGTRRRVWADGCHMKSVAGEIAYVSAVDYIRRHAEEGALIYEWSLNDETRRD